MPKIIVIQPFQTREYRVAELKDHAQIKAVIATGKGISFGCLNGDLIHIGPAALKESIIEFKP